MRFRFPQRVFVACITAFAFMLVQQAPAHAFTPITNDVNLFAPEVMRASCAADGSKAITTQLAQAAGLPAASAAPPEGASPSASPSATPPNVPIGPQTLTLPTLAPTGAAAATPPPLPTPSPGPTGSKAPSLLLRGSPEPDRTVVPKGSPTPVASATPAGVPTLKPGEVVTMADKVTGSENKTKPSDFEGNVHIFFSDEIAIGDKAHYDGQHTITLTGKPYIINQAGDTILRGDIVAVDTDTSIATLTNGRGETTQGVDVGKLRYTATKMTTDKAGKAHGDRTNITTCENPRSGYHIIGRSVDVLPGDKMIIRKATLFLGLLAVFYIPILIIPLKSKPEGQGNQRLLPTLGYSQAEGFYEKTRLGFGKDQYYYGFYTVDYATKLGPALGYDGTLTRKSGKRSTHIAFIQQSNKQTRSQNRNLNVSDTEHFSQRLSGQFNFSYTGYYAPGIFTPPQTTINAGVSYAGTHDNTSYSFNRSSTAGQNNQITASITEQHTFSPLFTQGFTLGYSDSRSTIPTVSFNKSLHLQTLTHVSTRSTDFDLTFDKTEAQIPSQISKLPELVIRPHPLTRSKIPFNAQFTYGIYNEPQSFLTTTRGEAILNIGQGAVYKIFRTSDLTANIGIRQEAYGTGDLKAQINQNASLTTAIGRHIVNAITYSENNTNGPPNVPFRTLDLLGGGSHSAQEVLHFFNAGVYDLSLSTGTSFNRMAQPVSYQLTARPSMRSYVTLGGSWLPGKGNGFGQTNAQLFTPLGKDTDAQFVTVIDWKNKARLTQKVIYLSHIFGQCYDVRVLYNQSLKTVNLSVDLLAFPNRAANFNITKNGPIVPGSFNF